MIGKVSFLDVYYESQRRYVEYYLVYSQDNLELETELPNLQKVLSWILNSDEKSYLPHFWNNLKDPLMDKGFWKIFVEWGEIILSSPHIADNTQTRAWLMADLGWLAMESGDYRLAKDRFLQSRDLFIEIDEYYGTCALERYLGVLAYRAGNLVNANSQYDKAYNIANAHNFKGMIAEIRNLQGSLALKNNELSLARQAYNESLAAFRELNDLWRSTAVLRNLARMEFKANDLSAAKITYTDAIKLCEELVRKDMLYGCQLGLAEVELNLGNIKKAKSLVSSARSGFVDLGMNIGLEKSHQLLARIREYE